jgi:hypothetical protein
MGVVRFDWVTADDTYYPGNHNPHTISGFDIIATVGDQ